MIELITIGDMHCPNLICDRCHKPINQMGIILWWTRIRDGHNSVPYAAHKGECDQTLTWTLTRDYPDNEWNENSEESDTFLQNLIHNHMDTR